MPGWATSERMGEVMPALTAEVEGLFRGLGREDLARQVAGLRFTSRCECRDEPACASFWVLVDPDPPEDAPDERFDLPVAEGMIHAQAVDGRLRSFEILERPEARRSLLALFPEDPGTG